MKAAERLVVFEADGGPPSPAAWTVMLSEHLFDRRGRRECHGRIKFDYLYAKNASVGQHVAMDLLVVVGTDQPPEHLAAKAHHILTVPVAEVAPALIAEIRGADPPPRGRIRPGSRPGGREAAQGRAPYGASYRRGRVIEVGPLRRRGGAPDRSWAEDGGGRLPPRSRRQHADGAPRPHGPGPSVPARRKARDPQSRR